MKNIFRNSLGRECVQCGVFRGAGDADNATSCGTVNVKNAARILQNIHT